MQVRVLSGALRDFAYSKPESLNVGTSSNLRFFFSEFHWQAVVAPPKRPIEEGTIAESAGIDDFRHGQFCRLKQHLSMYEPILQDEVTGRDLRELTHFPI